MSDLDPAEARRKLSEMLETMNNGGPLQQQIVDLRAQIERIEFNAAVEKAVAERLAEERTKAEAEAAAVEALPRRSAMTAAEKSRFLREFGRARYDALPWE